MALKMLFIHAVSNSTKHMKVIVKINQKTGNTFLGSFLVVMECLQKISLP